MASYELALRNEKRVEKTIRKSLKSFWIRGYVAESHGELEAIKYYSNSRMSKWLYLNLQILWLVQLISKRPQNFTKNSAVWLFQTQEMENNIEETVSALTVLGGTNECAPRLWVKTIWLIYQANTSNHLIRTMTGEWLFYKNTSTKFWRKSWVWICSLNKTWRR